MNIFAHRFFATLLCLTFGVWPTTARDDSIVAMLDQEPAKVRVAWVGDSNTAGVFTARASGMPVEKVSPPAILAHLLSSDVHNDGSYEIRNYGISGASILDFNRTFPGKKGPTSYLSVAAIEEIRAFRPEILIVALGANDSAECFYVGRQYCSGGKTDNRRLADDLVKILTTFTVDSVKTVRLVLPAPILGDNTHLKERNRVGYVVPIIKYVGLVYEVEVVDTDEAFSYLPLPREEYYLKDGVHFTPLGAEVYAQAVYDSLMGDKLQLAVR